MRVPRLLLLLTIIRLGSGTVFAQPLQTIYYTNGQKAMEGRWTYAGRGIAPTSRYDLESNHQWKFSVQHVSPNQFLRMDQEARVPDIVPTGPVTIWDVNGRTIQEITYDKGVAHGRYRQYFPSGRPQLEGEFRRGMPDGLWNRYDSSGNVMMSGKFRPYTDSELRDAWERQFRKTIEIPRPVENARRKRWQELPMGRVRDSARIAERELEAFSRIEYITAEPGIRTGEFRVQVSRSEPKFRLQYCDDIPCGTWTMTDVSGNIRLEAEFDPRGNLLAVRKAGAGRKTIDELLAAEAEMGATQQRRRDSIVQQIRKMPFVPDLSLIETRHHQKLRPVSALHRFGTNFYMASVDGATLYTCDGTGRVTDSAGIGGSPRSPKSVAGIVDFEAAARVVYQGSPGLLLLPPGTLGVENTDALLINPARPGTALATGDLIPFYREIVRQTGLDPRKLLIEAATVAGKEFYAANQGERRDQWLIRCNADSLLRSLFGKQKLPEVHCTKYTLNQIGFTPLGITGMMALDDSGVLVSLSPQGPGLTMDGSALALLRWKSNEKPALGALRMMQGEELDALNVIYEGLEIVQASPDGGMILRAVANPREGGVMLIDLKYPKRDLD